MCLFQFLLLPALVEPAERFLALNDMGEILISRPEKAARDGNFPGNGIYGIRFQTLTSRRITLRYSLPDPLRRAVSVAAINGRGEVVGGYPGSVGSEDSHGLFWDMSGKMLPLPEGMGIDINDVGQVLTDDTHVTDGQRFGDYGVALAPGVRGKSVGTVRLAQSTPTSLVPAARCINNRGAVAGAGMALWQPGAYDQGHIVEKGNTDNAKTPFTGGKDPVITDEGIIVCRRTSPRPVGPDTLRFRRWKPGASSTAIPLSFPADSIWCLSPHYRSGERTWRSADQRRWGMHYKWEEATPRGGCPVVQGRHVPRLQSGLLLNHRGWILGVTSAGEPITC